MAALSREMLLKTFVTGRSRRGHHADSILTNKTSHLRLANSGRIVSCPPQYFLRSSLFKIFPVPVFGKLTKNSTERGAL